ncbi:MAG: hypothetical protein DWQ07_06720 [Chloroflexi bacterium]|nr:MAG: hypothetical protein DWQ07_06720 [Chloroflexota bacterium]MBL1195607.1 hypothetical protein [Chloroflexota bacterium]NOH12894.1 hypothetical protein [Chloroflexota bacterium]
MKRHANFSALLFIKLFLLVACHSTTINNGKIIHAAAPFGWPNEDRDGCVVTVVPEELGFDPFYEKYCDADGIPIISSGEVDDLALKQAYYIMMNMLAPIPESRQKMISYGAYFAIIGQHEEQTTLPEYAHMDSEYWDQRARGLGGSIGLPITSAAEENLLCLPWDTYRGESIAVHEFAHTISLMDEGAEYDVLVEEFKSLYDSATEKGFWEFTYAGSDVLEYWAEGVQAYFNTKGQANRPDGIDNHVNTREELAEYDPGLFEFIHTFFHGYDWTPTCPREE